MQDRPAVENQPGIPEIKMVFFDVCQALCFVPLKLITM